MKKRDYIIGIIILVIDQLSKILMINKEFTIIPNVLNFTYTENAGAAFGIGKEYVVQYLSMIFIVGIIIYLIKNRSKIDNKIPFVFLIAGGLGNLIERIFRGYVIDFINIKLVNFPVFNIADICITIGIFGLIILIVKKLFKKTEKTEE